MNDEHVSVFRFAECFVCQCAAKRPIELAKKGERHSRKTLNAITAAASPVHQEASDEHAHSSSPMWILAASVSLVPLRVPVHAMFASPSLRRTGVVAAQEVTLAASFHALRKLDDRVRALETAGIAALSSFYEADKNGFSLTPGRDRVSVTSTCYSLYAINAAPSEWRQSPLRIAPCLHALYDNAPSDDDTMRAVLIVAAARLLDPEEKEPNEHLAGCIEAMLGARPRRREGRNSPISAYLRFWLAYATSLLPGVGGGQSLDRKDARLLTLQRSCDSAYDDLCRQLAFDAAGDDYSFDVVVLAYSLLTCVERH